MPDEPTPCPADTEGDNEDHAVPPELSELHEILEFQQAAGLGPHEQTA